MRLAKLVAIGGVMVAGAGCDNRPAAWKGFVYPNGAELTSHVELGTFKTFEECQTSAIEVIRGFDRAEATSQRPAADYECGFKCAPDPDLGGINVCKETRK